ncbi:MAG: nucleoside deaminase [Bacteroidetes bacterium]|jgi:guanine deaminase|nr:nucleoside deaminase [Bacteroidota bacterium]
MQENRDQSREKFMQEAIKLAASNLNSGKGGPFGAIVVKNGEIIGRGANQVTSTNDPTAHAEIVAIRDACKNLNSFQLDGCEIYASCEPCPMCLGAIYWARPSHLYFAASREDAAQAGFDDSYIYQQVPLKPIDRDIKSLQLLQQDAVQVFTLWNASDQKIPY